MEHLERRMKQIMIEAAKANSAINALDHGAPVGGLPYLGEDGGACLPGSAVSQPTATDDIDDIHDELEGDGRSSSREEKEEEEEEEKKEEEEGEEEKKEVDDGGDSSGKLHAAPQARALRMDLASCCLPDHDEDAHFVHPESGFVGVADGVGGLREKGVDASAFARALMGHALELADTTNRSQHIDPYDLLRKAYLKAARSRTPGASTAVIVSLRGTTLRWACLGDSGFAVFRGGAMVLRSEPQQRYFNCPYQLRATGGNRVRDAVVGEMPVVEDDVVVVGTDGLFDNVFDVDLERMVRQGTELGLSPQMMAEKIAATAQKNSKSRAPSPFSVESSRNVKDGRKRVNGGKVDDITVVVAYVVPESSS